MGPLKMLERRDIPPEIDVVHKFPPLLAHPLASWLHIRNRFYVCHASTSCYLSRNIYGLQTDYLYLVRFVHFVET